MGVSSAIRTIWGVVMRPATTFRRMAVDGPSTPPRLFLLIVAGLVGVAWAMTEWLALARPMLWSWAVGMVAAKGVLGLAYLEAVGVTILSGRRGWRVPFRLAERVACYASVGMLLAGLILLKARLVWAQGWVPLPDGFYGAIVGPIAVCALLAGAILGFELLVWLGVRQVRFANQPHGRDAGQTPGDRGGAPVTRPEDSTEAARLLS